MDCGGPCYGKAAQVQQINAQIEELQEIKRGYEARALRHEDQAIYLQFNDKALLEQRRHIQIAQDYRAKAARVQIEIDQLKEQRDKLQK